MIIVSLPPCPPGWEKQSEREPIAQATCFGTRQETGSQTQVAKSLHRWAGGIRWEVEACLQLASTFSVKQDKMSLPRRLGNDS